MDFRAIVGFFGIWVMYRVSFLSLSSAILVLSSSLAFSANSAVRDLVVPADDGYGMDECLAEGGPCAKLIADSWCQVNGMRTSIGYIAADITDVTASLSKKTTNSAPRPSYIVTCAE
jgi:hypothetical protein